MAGYYLVRSRRLSQATWEDLMAKLSKTDRDGITMVARELVDEWGEPRAGEEDVAGLEPAQLWSLVGGLEGLQVLEKNSEVLIEIAFYVQRWYPEALVISERLRLDARELRWHVSRLKGAARTGNLQISFPFYARRAVTIYYLMTRRVLRLYEAAQFSNLNELQQAL
jgi:hypothetical protein